MEVENQREAIRVSSAAPGQSFRVDFSTALAGARLAGIFVR